MEKVLNLTFTNLFKANNIDPADLMASIGFCHAPFFEAEKKRTGSLRSTIFGGHLYKFFSDSMVAYKQEVCI